MNFQHLKAPQRRLGVRAEAPDPETVRLPEKDIRDRMLVRAAAYVPDSKADRSRFTEDFLREASTINLQKFIA